MKVLTFELLNLNFPAQTLCPTTNTIFIFARVFQFSSSYSKLHPLKLFAGANHLLTRIPLCGQEEQQALLPSSLTVAGRIPLHGVCTLCLPTHMEAVFPLAAPGQRGSVTCAVDVILCKSTSEFRPVSINLLL